MIRRLWLKLSGWMRFTTPITMDPPKKPVGSPYCLHVDTMYEAEPGSTVLLLSSRVNGQEVITGVWIRDITSPSQLAGSPDGLK